MNQFTGRSLRRSDVSFVLYTSLDSQRRDVGLTSFQSNVCKVVHLYFQSVVNTSKLLKGIFVSLYGGLNFLRAF